jgi:glycosyltransferase involved in cell wall biosynthesis
LPEVVGSAGVLVDPLEAEAITEAMRKLSSGEIERATLRRLGLEQAAGFSWGTAAERVIDVYGQVMDERTRAT